MPLAKNINYIAGMILNDTDNTGWRNKICIEIVKHIELQARQHFFARQVKFKAQIKKANGNLQSSFSSGKIRVYVMRLCTTNVLYV